MVKKLLLGSFVFSSLFAVSLIAGDWTGFVGDSMCGAKHTGAGKGDTACSQKCVKGGADAVFVTGGKVLKFDAASVASAKEHVGQNVKISGSLNGDTVTIASIEEAK
jgi:hypothetical protein